MVFKSFRKWLKSTNFAIEGILHAAKTQRHLLYHFYSAAAVLILCFILGVSRIEFLIISLSIIAVLLAEMCNTAIENVVDIVSPKQSEKARVAKDIAAGAVLITAFGASVIGYIVLFPYLSDFFRKGIHITKHSSEEVAVMSLVIVIILVIITKTYFGKGLPLRGGMPSGHAALAFSAWVASTFITENFVVSVLTFAVAVVIGQSRIILKAHSIWEVILGSLMGALVTYLLFRIFA